MTTSNEHNNAPAVPQTVYLVENRTCLLAYASREDADKAVASMPASVGGGFLVSPVQVFGATAPAVPQGWKLVPVEPTRAMWAAVNKLDDEMAAGSYDGKGCSIEQAWNCMLGFAPDAPALAATPAPAPAVPQGAFLSITEGRIKEIASRFGAVRNAVSFAREIEHEFRALLAATPAPAPAQGKPFGYFRAEPFGWTDCSEDAEGAIALYEHPAKPAREVATLSLAAEDVHAAFAKNFPKSRISQAWINFAADIAQAIAARAAKPVQDVGLPCFDDLDDSAIDDACTAGGFYRVDFMRAWEALRAKGAV